MKKITVLMTLFLSVSLLMGCNPQAKIESTETTKSPEVAKSVSEETVAEVQTSESNLNSTELIPLATWIAIDVNQLGKVSATELVDYYVTKVSEEDKLIGTEAYAKFKILDQDGNGELTKEEATGAK